MHLILPRLPFGTTVSSPSLVADTNKTYRITRLYDIEQSPNCRQVRERITELDLAVETVVPAASNARAWNDESYEYYLGKDIATAIDELPIIIVADEDNKEKTLVGLNNIMHFLNDTYGNRSAIIDDVDEIKTKVAEFLIEVGSYIPNLVRFGRGDSVAGCANLKAKIQKPLVSGNHKRKYGFQGQICFLLKHPHSLLYYD